MSAKPWWVGGMVLCVFAVLLAADGQPAVQTNPAWSPRAAANYLDQRESWWGAWPVAARDQGTFCISCHTALPYALARPGLSAALHEGVMSPNDLRLLANVRKRVQLGNAARPYYTDAAYGAGKAAQSRGTEAVLNALILASHDAREGKLSLETRAAFDNLWRLQQTTGENRGAWQWLQFNNEPFEAHDSQYYGAALAAVAVGVATGNYRSNPAIQSNLRLLQAYFNRNYADQSAINRVTLLWASATWPGLITAARRQSILNDILRQQLPDGGWSLTPLSWTWRDWSAKSLIKLWGRSNVPLLESRSDGYATGLIAYALEEIGVPASQPPLKRALRWLERNQNAQNGSWPGYSLNNHVDPASDMGRFMSDAATGFAVLALSKAQARTLADRNSESEDGYHDER